MGKFEPSRPHRSGRSCELLPLEILQELLGYLPLADRLAAQAVCRQWYRASRSTHSWRSLDCSTIRPAEFRPARSPARLRASYRAQLESVRKLGFWDSNVDPRWVTCFLESTPRLRVLDLGGNCCITSPEFERMIDRFPATLAALVLEGCRGIGAAAFAKLADWVGKRVRRPEAALRLLDLSKTCVGDDAIFAMGSHAVPFAVGTLALRRCHNISPAGWKAVFSSLPAAGALTSLDAAGNWAITPRAWAGAAKRGGPCSVRTVDVRDCEQLTRKDVSAAAATWKKWGCVVLENAALEDYSAEAIKKFLAGLTKITAADDGMTRANPDSN